jgi:kumamolisin
MKPRTIHLYNMILIMISCLLLPEEALADNAYSNLPGHVPEANISQAQYKGRMATAKQLDLTVALPLRNQSDLKILLQRLYNPKDALYGKYLTPTEFTANYGPTQTDYDAVKNYFISKGYAIGKSHENRTLLKVSASVAKIENSLQVNLNTYTKKNKSFYAPDTNPELPSLIATKVIGIIGLDNSVNYRPHNRILINKTKSAQSPLQNGTGPGNAFSPNDIRKAYNLTTIPTTGKGQVVALVELDGYTTSDILTYQQYYHLPAIPLENVLVDGFDGTPSGGSGEVTLDIEMVLAVAQGLEKIIVYEGPNDSSNNGLLSIYQKIADDNTAKQISTSWGSPERDIGKVALNADNQIFMQMAAQGQTLFAASGDNGAYDTPAGHSLNVDDPASNPYVVGVGGTSLILDVSQNYSSESVWNDGLASRAAGGGGVSVVWPIPSYQIGVPGIASSRFRNVPDVALNSDPDTGYSVYYDGQWQEDGGTSAAAPLWAAYLALVNEQRVLDGKAVMGHMLPRLYALEATSSYLDDFHDITQGNNFHYRAGPGYDNATGLGTINSNLFNDLIASDAYGSQVITFNLALPLWVENAAVLSATASSGLTVTYKSKTPLICKLSGGTVTAIKVGSCTITANQSGSANFSAAPEVTQDIAVTKIPQSILFSPITYIRVKQSIQIPASSTSGLALKYKTFTPDICSVKGSKVTAIKVGSCTITANQSGSANFSAAQEVTQAISVGPSLPK